MTDAIDYFDQKTLAYTYDNGWNFTNFFDRNTRISAVEGRGVLHETVTVTEISADIFMIFWEDEHMGPLTQVVDFSTQRVFASVPWEGKMEIWPGVITRFVDGKDAEVETTA